MNAKEIAYRKHFVGCGEYLSMQPEAAEWKALHEARGRLIKETRKLLDRCEADKRDPSNEELDAMAVADALIDGISKEMEARDEAGTRAPRGPQFAPAPGVRNASGEREETPRAHGGVGLSYRALFFGSDAAKLPKPELSYSEFVTRAITGNYEGRTMTTALTDGGAQVPELWAGRIFDSVREASICVPRCFLIPMQGATLHYPAWDSSDRTAGPIGAFRGRWLEEAATAQKATPKMRLVTFEAKKLAVFVDCSREVLEDGISLEAQIGPTLRASLSWSMDNAVINGSNIAQPAGILHSPATIAVKRAVANQIAYADVMGMFSRLLPGSAQNAVWLCSPGALRQLLGMVDLASHYVWLPGMQSAAGPVPPTLLGCPVFVSDKCPDLGTCGDLVLADFSYYGLALRKDIIFERTNSHLWAEDLVSFRAIVRFDGRPLLDKPITPANGGSTLSPFVMLDTP